MIDYWLKVEIVQHFHQSVHRPHKPSTVFQPASSTAKLNYRVSIGNN